MEENRDFEREFIPPPLPGNADDPTENGGEFIPPPLPHNEPTPTAPPKKQEPTGEGGSNKKRAVVALVTVIAIAVVVVCLVIGKTGIISEQGGIAESDYKQTIREHFDDVHQQSVQSYTFDEFEMGEDGASAKLQVKAYIQPSEYAADIDASDYGIAYLTSTIQIDETGSITFCSLCNLLGVQDVEDTEDEENSSVTGDYGDEPTQPETVSATAGDLVINIAEYAPMDEEAKYTYSERGEWNLDILVTSDIQNFKIVMFVLGDDSDLHVDGVLDEVAFLSAGDVLKVGLSLGDITNRSVAYMDGEGKQHVYGIGVDGYDGSIYAIAVSLPDIDYRYWPEGTYGELSAQYGDVSRTFYQGQLNYFVFEKKPDVAFAFESPNYDVEGLVPDDGDRCIAVLASAETLFGLEYSVNSVELQVALGVENVESLYTL